MIYIHIVAEILSTVAESLILAWFIPRFTGEKIGRRWWAFAFPALQLGAQLYFNYRLKPGFNILPIAVSFVFAAAYAVVLNRKRIVWDIFGAVCFISVTVLTSSSLLSVFSLFTNNTAELMHGSHTEARLIYLVCVKIVQLGLCCLLVKLFNREKKSDPVGGIFAVLMTIETVFALSALVSIATSDEVTRTDTTILILCISLVLVNLLYFFIRQIQKLRKSDYELSLMKERIVYEEKRAEEANIIWNNIRKVRHDLNNHFTVLSAYLDDGDVEACKEYLSEISNTVSSMGKLLASGNSVLDYLINTKLSNLEDVKVLISGYIESFEDIKDSDMVCMLGNILDNAVEAVKRQEGDRQIELHFAKVNQNRIIVCKNTVASSVLETNKGLLTTKKDASSHGLGHKIVEETVKKYNGLIDYFEEDGMFGVQISIP